MGEIVKGEVIEKMGKRHEKEKRWGNVGGKVGKIEKNWGN